MKRFTSEEDQYLKDNYLIFSAREIERQLGRSTGSVRYRYRILGLIVPEEIIKQNRYFQKGYTPFNKGEKQEKWMSAEGIKICENTQLKKGCIPWHAKKEIEIVKWQRAGGKPYLVIYFKSKKWFYLHRYIWEQQNGEIPKGFKLAFKDGNTLNCNIENLEVISCAELMQHNSGKRFGPDLYRIIRLRGALNRKINKRLKQLSNEK
jgi:hypothetical protein